MIVKCAKGCGAKFDVPDITNAEDAANAPIPCESCWEKDNAARRKQGYDAFTDSWEQ